MRIQNKMDILATPQPSATEYDWSLLGLNKDVLLEEEEEGEESEWGILTIDNEEEEEGEIIIREPFHSTINQPHDQSGDQSCDQCGNQSSDQSRDQSCDQSGGDHQVDDGGSGNESHDQSIITISNVDDVDNDANTRSHDANTDTNAESQDQSHDVKTESGITHRQPSSYSWSESGVTETPSVSGSRSYSLSVPMESLPPLFSYDEGHLLGLSPSLVSNLLSDPEQVRHYYLFIYFIYCYFYICSLN